MKSLVVLITLITLLGAGGFSFAETPIAPAPKINPAVCALPLLQKFLQVAMTQTDVATKLKTVNALKIIAKNAAKTNPAAAQKLLSQLSSVAAGTLPPTSPELTKSLAYLMMDPKGMRATQLSLRNKDVQQGFFALFSDMHSKNFIRPMFEEAANSLKADPAVLAQLGPKAQYVLNNPPLLNAALDEATGVLDNIIKLERQSPDYWQVLAKTSAARSKKALAPFQDKIVAGTLRFDDPAYLKMLEKELKTKFLDSSLARLPTGPEAKTARSKLVNDADEITMFTWAFYDDATGKEIAEDLKKAADRGVPIKLMVDGQTSMKPGHDALVKELAQKKGVEVIYWKSPDENFPYYGNHRKALVVGKKNANGQTEYKALLGGRNPGDVYYTTWDDSEVIIDGPAVKGLLKNMATTWNDAIPTAKAMGSNATPIQAPKLPAKVATPSGSVTATIDHVPGPKSSNPIYQAHRVAMDSMSKGDEVLIENAYAILDPGFYRSILSAQKRGVKITVLSNSLQSVDEPIVANPVARTMGHLATAKLNQLGKMGVYVKKGEQLTDHTKVTVFLRNDGKKTVDGMVIDMSHNHHPRSLRLEGETAALTVGKDPALDAAKVIRARARKATLITDTIKTEGNPLEDELITRMGFYELL